MKRFLLGLGVGAGIGYAARRWLPAREPRPPWEETDNDPEDLTSDLAQRAREAQGADAQGAEGAAEEAPAT